MRDAVIEVRSLVRTFRVRPRRRGLWGAVRDLFGGEYTEVRALDAVSFDVRPGEIVGYIGPNGAGKSTTIKLLSGILQPTSGTVRVCGLDPWARRDEHVRNLGVVFGQRTALWWDLAVIEAYDLLAAVFGLSDDVYKQRLSELSTLLDLEPLLRTPVRELSLGQRVRCDLAGALLHAPKVVLLDEPTIGLDVAVKLRVRKFIRKIADERGVAVVLATHDLGDVEQLCDRVLLVDHGVLVFEGDVPALRVRLGGQRTVRAIPRDLDVDVDGLAMALGLPVRQVDGGLEVTLNASSSAGAVVEALLRRVDVDDLRITEPSIEDVVGRFYETRS